ncbi:nitroreductase/quinone reductase family protein [Micromonospora sp. NPDC007230]|uniref:nitroreductase/quinone reductase family protein n=1 Tax=Micromonospora sp. NPDC007230 TaxID=3364237 RepID=UPI003678E371
MPVHEFAYLTTVGRRSGRPHTIEIWYAEHQGVRYVLSGDGDGADWVRNLRREPSARLRLGGPRELHADLPGTAAVMARFVAAPAEEAVARRLLAAKYQGWREGEPLSDWAATSLVVAFEPPG